MSPTKPRVFYQHQRPKRRVARKRRIVRRPMLTVAQILAWADAFHARTGRWPNADTGKIADAIGENWNAVDQCLYKGCRGLPGGLCLARLLAEQRGVRNRLTLPQLKEEQILAWADEHYKRIGEWPTLLSGRIVDAAGEEWRAVNACLQQGCRGLPGGSSLARLLAEHRDVRNKQALPALTHKQILTWADAYHDKYGDWPRPESGKIDGTNGETWFAVEMALNKGQRGLHGGLTIPRLLAKHRGVRNKAALPPLTHEQILKWADAFHRRSGRWPRCSSTIVVEGEPETWKYLDSCLRDGVRGLSGGYSFAQLLADERGVRNVASPPKLTRKQILTWADKHHNRTGEWPKRFSGPIVDAPGETWNAVDLALMRGP